MKSDSEDNSVIHVSFIKEGIDRSEKQNSFEIKEEIKVNIELSKQSISNENQYDGYSKEFLAQVQWCAYQNGQTLFYEAYGLFLD